MIKITPFSNNLVGRKISVSAKMTQNTYDFVVDVLGDLGYIIEEVEVKGRIPVYEVESTSTNIVGTNLMYQYMSKSQFSILSHILPYLSYSIKYE